MKEKLDLSLDHRQVVSLLISGLVVLAAVFVLGVVVGKKLAVTPGTVDAPDLLAALDRKNLAMDKVRESPALTFPEELTRKGVDPVIADAGHVSPTAPVAVVPVPSPSKTVTVPDDVDGRMLEAKAAQARSAEKLRDALARAEKEKPSVHLSPANPPPTPSSGAFTLQLAATSTRSEAERHVGKLRERGYAPYIVSAEVPGKGTWYRVRMGNFGTKEVAQKFLSDFKRETQLDAFIANVP